MQSKKEFACKRKQVVMYKLTYLTLWYLPSGALFP